MDPIESDLIGAGRLGITLCPRRRDRGRDLGTDLTPLRSEGATRLPYLLPDSELHRAGVPDLGPEPRPPAEHPGRSAHPSGRLLRLARTPRTGEHEPMEEVQRLLDQLVTAGAPGAAAWIHDEHGSVQAASGVADLRARRPMRPGLHFRAGSLTKSLVATVVLQLVAEGRLSLSDTLERWLPAILPYGDQVTIHQLLNHTSGVPDYWATVERTLYGSRQGRLRAWTPQALVGLVADQPPGFPPGTAWSYSNTGYVLLGLIVEAATGNTLARELGRCIFGPLGLHDTLLPGNSPGIPSPTSRGYSLPLSPQGEVITGPLLDFTAQNPSWAWAAGALVSTLEDLAHFFQALLGGPLLPPRLLAEMLSTVAVPPGSVPLPLYDRYGLGLLEVETPAGRLVGNVGGIPGFLSIALSTPDGRRQLGVMINVLAAPDPVYEAFTQLFRELGPRLLSKRR